MLKNIDAKISDNQVSANLNMEILDRAVLVKKLHDLSAALRTIDFCSQALQEGYRFNDEAGEAKIAAVAKANKTLQDEASLLTDLYKACIACSK